MYQTKIQFEKEDLELEIQNIIYLKIKAQNATSGPPIGPIFGQCGIPAAPFCKEFNDRSSIFNTEVELYVNVYIYNDNSYDFDIELPSNSYFIKKAAFRITGYPKPG
jgi:large subunit ribosomal protein L11